MSETPTTPTHQAIAARAFEISKDRPWASPTENWVLAERQLAAEAAPQAPVAPAVAAPDAAPAAAPVVSVAQPDATTATPAAPEAAAPAAAPAVTGATPAQPESSAGYPAEAVVNELVAAAAEKLKSLTGKDLRLGLDTSTGAVLATTEGGATTSVPVPPMPADDAAKAAAGELTPRHQRLRQWLSHHLEDAVKHLAALGHDKAA